MIHTYELNHAMFKYNNFYLYVLVKGQKDAATDSDDINA